MTQILKGNLVVETMNQTMIEEVADLKSKGVVPTLAILRIGEKPDDLAYEQGIIKRCETVGVTIKKILLPDNVTQEVVMAAIQDINKDDGIHGCMIFRPLPAHLDEQTLCDALIPDKDVDGITRGSMVGVFMDEPWGFPPCTAQACMKILDYYGVELTGQKAVVIGRSHVIGKPVAMMLLKENATITICHSRSKDLPQIVKEADIVIAAVGRTRMIDENFFSPNQIVIDVGINFTEDGEMCGDVDSRNIDGKVKAYTPVPGGVGTVTTSVLVSNVVKASQSYLK